MRVVYILVLAVVLGVGVFALESYHGAGKGTGLGILQTEQDPSSAKDAPAVNTPGSDLSGSDGSQASTREPVTRQDTPLPENLKVTGQNSTGDNSELSSQAVIKGTLHKGDTVAKILEDWGNSTDVQRYVKATNSVFPLRSFRAGHPYVLVCDVESGSVKRFEYEIDNNRKLVVESGEDNDTTARVEKIHYDVSLALIEGRIEDNLFKSVADLGESPQLALLIANLFGWEINFIRDIRDGDSFSILVEKLYRDGEYKGYGRTLGATFTNEGKIFEAFLFNDASGREHYYNAKGENLKKTLLQAPLSFTRITSGYSKSRKHPIFGTHKAHFGVDYGAPTGTPVKAVGDGVVILRGWVGGYGNQVVIKHSGGLESMYSHLSGFARGLKKGSRVRQGQVVAYVGSTGYSTGPHLDFRLKQRGNFINPTKAINPRSEPVHRNMQQQFAKRIQFVRSFMQKQRELADFTPSMIAAVEPRRSYKDDDAEKSDDKPSRKKRRNGKKQG